MLLNVIIERDSFLPPIGVPCFPADHMLRGPSLTYLRSCLSRTRSAPPRSKTIPPTPSVLDEYKSPSPKHSAGSHSPSCNKNDEFDGDELPDIVLPPYHRRDPTHLICLPRSESPKHAPPPPVTRSRVTILSRRHQVFLVRDSKFNCNGMAK